MQHWVETYEYKPVANEYQYFTEDTMAYDIETTGLSRKYHHVYMIGCSLRCKDQITIHQFFAESVDEEAEIISAFFDLAIQYPKHMTFNGATFDLPFLEERAAKYNLTSHLQDCEHLDIFKECKKLKKMLQLPSCRQKSIEQFLGIHREDLYSGGELIKVYEDYQTSKDSEALHLLKIHNYEDMEGMLAILPILSYKDIACMNILDVDVTVEECQHMNGTTGQELSFCCTTDFPALAPFRLKTEYGYFIVEENKIRGIIPLIHGTYRHYFDDYKNYVYLPEEDICILKTLASSIPKERKVKAKREQCYVEKEGTYILVPPKYKCLDYQYTFKKEYKDKTPVVMYDDIISTIEFFQSFISSCFQ